MVDVVRERDLPAIREAIQKHAARLITSPKALSNSRLKHALGYQPQYPSYSEGLEEVLRDLSHHA